MKRGLILINAYNKLVHSMNQSERLKAEFEKIGVAADIRRNDFFAAFVSDGGKITSKVADYDFCVYLDKDKYVSYMLEKSGMRLFNRPRAVEACDDKMTTSVILADHGIPMPETASGLLCYNPEESLNEKALDTIGNRLGYPLVVKTSYGSLGRGVYKADSREQLLKVAEELKCTPHLFQKFISSSSGRDMRVIVIGGRCVAAMERRSDGDFRSNLELGGTGMPVELPEEVAVMCERAADILGLDYCGVDVLYGEHGYYLCEVNSNAFFGGIERVTGINIAEKYARYIYATVYGS